MSARLEYSSRRCWWCSTLIPALDPGGEPAAAAAAEPAVHGSRRLDALCLRQLRAGVRAWRYLRAAVQGDQGQASGLLLRPPAIAAGARCDERARSHDRLELPHARHRHRRTVGDAGAFASPIRGRRPWTSAIPKILAALLCWFVYSFALVARTAVGWSGRRAAWLSTIGFVIVLLTFVPVGYFFTKSHNF